MPTDLDLCRHVHALVADLAAEHGEVDLVGRRLECDADARDALVEAFDAFGVVGGAGVRVRDRKGRVLLVRYEGADGWVDPGGSRRPGESYRECARRAVRETTGVETTVGDLAQVHLLYMDDWTDRDPVPNPYGSYEGQVDDTGTGAGAGGSEGGSGAEWHDDVTNVAVDVDEVRWAETVPGELLYEELAELALGT